MNTRTQHLTDAEFSDVLSGDMAEDARLHLAACDFCRNELILVRESLASFSGLSTRWANAAAPEYVPVPSRLAMRLGLLPSWSTGLAVTALTGLLVFNFGPAHYSRTRAVPGASASATVSVPSTTELAEDNRLMASIDQELGYQQTTSQAQSDTSGTKIEADHKLEPAAPGAVVD